MEWKQNFVGHGSNQLGRTSGHVVLEFYASAQEIQTDDSSVLMLSDADNLEIAGSMLN